MNPSPVGVDTEQIELSGTVANLIRCDADPIEHR